MKRAIATLTATALALGWTTACEPPPPPVSFMVNSDADAADTNPGDGVCETAPATGHCTLTAAIEEGNALGRADIVIPDSNLDVAYPLGDSTVTGRLTITGPPIRPEGPGPGVALRSLRIASGGTLTLDRIGAWSSRDTDAALVTVDGTLEVKRSALFVPVVVSESGSLTLLQAALTSVRPAVSLTVRGTAAALYTTVLGSNSQPALDVAATGQVQIGASQIVPAWETDPCDGSPVTSLGYNVSAGPSCELTGPGDVVSETFPQDATVDRVPQGVLGCGTSVTTDPSGRPRPLDGDGDGIAACDAGPVETTGAGGI